MDVVEVIRSRGTDRRKPFSLVDQHVAPLRVGQHSESFVDELKAGLCRLIDSEALLGSEPFLGPDASDLYAGSPGFDQGIVYPLQAPRKQVVRSLRVGIRDR